MMKSRIVTRVKNHDSPIGIAKGYVLGGRGSTPGKENKFSVLHSVETGFAAHPASYAMNTGAFPPGIKRLKVESDHSPPSSAEFKRDGVVPPITHTTPWHGA